MASATGIPERPPAGQQEPQVGESEPLLGRPGDVMQLEDAAIVRNVTMGTGILAMLGGTLVLLLVWTGVFMHPLILFSAHPIIQSSALFVLVVSILVLQPTHTDRQKRVGQAVHATLNLAVFLLFVAGIAVIEYNKAVGNRPHFQSAHGVLGLLTGCVLIPHYVVGFTMWATPRLYGGRERAQRVWRYHRLAGYLILMLILVTVCSATEMTFNIEVMDIKLWATVLGSALIFVGVFARIHKSKFGWGPPPAPLEEPERWRPSSSIL